MSSEGEETGHSLDIGSESRGSSVSTGLREEYEDLLRYAVVTPVIDLSMKGPGSKIQHHPSPVVPPRPQTPPPYISRQPEVSKIASDISDPSDLHQDDTATPLIRPPPPFTTMNVQHQNPSQSSELHFQSHDESVESHDQEEEEETTIRAHDVDPEMARLGTQLDGWCLDLKRNILAEFEQSRMRLLERRESELQKERQQHAYELREARAQLEQYKELLATYEQSIGRKDHVIANLTKALQKQKDRVELQRSFGSWKLRHCDDRRESFTSTLARKHYHVKVKGRVWGAWFGLIQTRWKQRVEKACQSKAEEVCVQLTGEYEEQLEVVHRSLEESQAEVQRLKAERDLYEENMKKAFMRGVCALNMEAMSMFRYHDADDGLQDDGPSKSQGESDTSDNTQEDGHLREEHVPASRATQPVPPLKQHLGKNIRVTASAAPNHVTRTNGHVSRGGLSARRGKGTASAPKQRPEVVVQKH